MLVTRNIQNSEPENAIATYLKQQGVELDSYFIDTGYHGSIPELAIRALANESGRELSKKEIDRRVKLLSSSEFGRQSIAARGVKRGKGANPVDRIEDRPLSMESPSNYEVTPEGKLVPEETPTSPGMQLSAWVVEHAVMRNFAPRFEPEKRAHPPREMEGHRFIERFSGGGVVATHPLELWEDEHGEKYLLKGGPEHTLRADYVGARLFERMYIKRPEADLIRVDGELKLKLEYLAGWEDGPITLPERFHKSEKIQEGFFVDLLLQQYDRTSWNLMFQGDDVAFIDHGAGLHSRARGGFKGFSMDITPESIAEVLEHPQRQGKVVNEAYSALMAVEGGKLVIKDRLRVEKLLNHFSERLGSAESFFNTIIDEAGFADGRRAVERLEKNIETLEGELRSLPADSRDATKHRGAITTMEQMIAVGGEATYLKKALARRAAQIVDLFYKALQNPVLSQETNDTIFPEKVKEEYA